jgi:hypothetical protein
VWIPARWFAPIMEGMADVAATVLVLDEADYQYGMGRLRIRVEQVDRANPVSYDGEPWFRVTGIQIGRNGAEIGPRQILVRGRRLPSR